MFKFFKDSDNLLDFNERNELTFKFFTDLFFFCYFGVLFKW